MLFTLLIIIACCIMFAAPLNVSLVMIVMVLWSGMGLNSKYGCLGSVFNIILFVAGAILIIVGLWMS